MVKVAVVPTRRIVNSPVRGESRVSRYGWSMHFTRPRDLVVAGLLGLVLGYLLFVVAYVFPRPDELVAAVLDTRAGVVGVVSSAALVAGGLWLEHCCRTPRDQDREHTRGTTG